LVAYAIAVDGLFVDAVLLVAAVVARWPPAEHPTKTNATTHASAAMPGSRRIRRTERIMPDQERLGERGTADLCGPDLSS
jgi:hypothetical protein